MNPDNKKFENLFEKLFRDVDAQVLDTTVSATLPVDTTYLESIGTIGSTEVTPTPTNTNVSGINITLNASNTSPDVGDQISVDIELASGPTEVSSFDLEFLFDSNKLTYVDTTYTDSFFAQDVFIDSDQPNGSVSISATALDGANTVNRVIGSMNFTVASYGDYFVETDSVNSRVLGATNNEVTITTDDVSQTINTPDGVVTAPTTTPYPTQSTDDGEIPVIGLSGSATNVLPASNLANLGTFGPYIIGAVALVVGGLIFRSRRNSTDDYEF